MPIRTDYTDAFREQALQKVYQRGERSIASVAEQLNVNLWTLKNWMKARQIEHRKGARTKTPSAVRTDERSAGERMQLLLDSHGLSEQALGAFCREHGVFTHQLQQWREGFERATTSTPVGRDELRQLKHAHGALERELTRKEKALAEAAALLVLQKKYRALWEDKDE